MSALRTQPVGVESLRSAGSRARLLSSIAQRVCRTSRCVLSAVAGNDAALDAQ